MRRTPSTGLSRVVAVLVTTALALLAGVPFAAPAAAAKKFAAPGDFHAVDVAGTTMSFSWDKVSGAPAYRITYSTSSTMTKATAYNIDGTYAELSGLKPAKNYYVRVKVIDMAGGTLSSYGPPLKVTTRAASANPLIAPVLDAPTVAGADSLHLSWTNRGAGVAYRVKYYPTGSESQARTTLFGPSGGTLDGLDSDTRYVLQVKAVSTDGSSDLSDYSTAVTAPATAKTTPALAVATYNVAKWDGKPWKDRRKNVAATILAADVDVIAIQEASGGRMSDAQDGSNDGKQMNQFDDLLALLGNPYRGTDTDSKGTRLIYNSDTVKLGDYGALRLPEANGGDSNQYAVWAVLTQKSSGKQFFFVGTHLYNGRTTYGYNTRVAESKAILALADSGKNPGLPVLIAGDMNSHKGHTPSNGPYDVFTGAGYGDPLGNTQKSWAIADTATAEHMINNQYNSFNDFASSPVKSKYANGYHVDEVFHSPSIRVAEWQMVLRLNSDGTFTGGTASDHNLVKAVVHLP